MHYLYVCQDQLSHIVTNSEENSITSVYYNESYYKTYYKTKRPKQWNKAPCHRQMTGGGTCLEQVFIKKIFILCVAEHSSKIQEI
jgi:hypothetical protein